MREALREASVCRVNMAVVAVIVTAGTLPAGKGATKKEAKK